MAPWRQFYNSARDGALLKRWNREDGDPGPVGARRPAVPVAPARTGVHWRPAPQTGTDMSDNWRRVAAAIDIPAEGMRAFDLGGREVVVCNTREGFFALDNTCSHAEAKMDEGRLRGCRIVCPLHGGSFDVRNGAALGAPAVSPLRSYAVRVVDGEIEVEVGDSLPMV